MLQSCPESLATGRGLQRVFRTLHPPSSPPTLLSECLNNHLSFNRLVGQHQRYDSHAHAILACRSLLELRPIRTRRDCEPGRGTSKPHLSHVHESTQIITSGPGTIRKSISIVVSSSVVPLPWSHRLSISSPIHK